MENEIDTFERLNNNLKTHFENVEGAYLGAGDGWYNLIYTLTNCIDNHVSYLNRRDNANNIVRVAQIKEKFGGLRYYLNGYYDEKISGMISLAESLSYTICETCGKPGTLRKGGWIKTLCDEHEHERQERYRELYGDEIYGDDAE